MRWKILLAVVLIGGCLMPHGQPDYGMYTPATTIYRLADMGELAARLGSIHTFDRRGEIVWLTSFEEGIASWYTNGVGTGWAVAQSTEWSRSGMCSAKLTCGSTSQLYAVIERYLPYPRLSNIGIEFSFYNTTDIASANLTVYLYEGTEYNKASIIFNFTLDKIYYLNSAGAPVELVSNANMEYRTKTHHTAKLVIDFENNEYKRFLFDHEEYDLSDIALFTEAYEEQPYLEIELPAWGTSGHSDAYFYIDDVIVTQNEP